MSYFPSSYQTRQRKSLLTFRGDCRLDDLCDQLLRSIQKSARDVPTFINVAVRAEKARLIDEQRFRTWLVDYIAQHAERLMESAVLRESMEGGGEVAWRLCSLLMSSLSQCRQEAAAREAAAREAGAREAAAKAAAALNVRAPPTPDDTPPTQAGKS